MFLDSDSLAKTFIVFGLILIIVGLLVHFGGKFVSLGRLPGDINIERDNFTFSFPIVTSILLSIIVTIILNLFFRR